MPRKPRPKPPSSPAPRSPGSMRSCAKIRPGPAPVLSASRSPPPPPAWRRAGRNEDEAALRDALHRTWPGGDPGPAGRRLLAWRALAAGSAGEWRSAIAGAVSALDLPGDDALLRHDRRRGVKAHFMRRSAARSSEFAAQRNFICRTAPSPSRCNVWKSQDRPSSSSPVGAD